MLRGMDADSIFIWRLTRTGRHRWRLRLALVLYVVGLHRLAVLIGAVD